MNPAQSWYFTIIWGVSTLLQVCSPQLLDYDQPEQLQDFLEKITHGHSTSSLLKLSHSYEKQPIFCVKIGKGNSSNHAIIVEFGAHAREWVSHTSATHVIYELLNNPKYDELIRKLTWYIVPLLNPDGFRFSKSNETNRLWRKNRRPISNDCIGVDVNRNFPEHWDWSPTCGDEYAGSFASSERETNAIMQLFRLIPKGKVAAYISVHSDSQSILLPFGYTYDRPKNWKRLQEVAWKMKYAMEGKGSPIYEVYKASDLYLATGSSVDWAYNKQGVPLAFTLELPYQKGKYNHQEPFTANSKEKVIIARQCIAALKACASEILKGSPEDETQTSNNVAASKPNGSARGFDSFSMPVSVAGTWVIIIYLRTVSGHL